jgi:hypothetical protein
LRSGNLLVIEGYLSHTIPNPMLLISVQVWEIVQSERDQACHGARIALRDIRAVNDSSGIHHYLVSWGND